MRKITGLIVLMLFFGSISAQDAPEGLFINSKAPDFRAKDQAGKEVRLKDLLKEGKVVLVFYRGYWDPFCHRMLKKLQDSLQLIKDKKATVIAVSAEKPDLIKYNADSIKVEYPILYDEQLKIMKAYEVEYVVPENTVTRLRNTGIDLEKINGNKDWNYLPITAVYIIDKESAVTYRFFNSDYKKRPSVAEILKNLESPK